MDPGGSFPWGKVAGTRETDHSPPSSMEVKHGKFLFICNLFNDDLTNSDGRMKVHNNIKGCGRNRSSSNLSCYIGICLGGLRKTTQKNPVRTVGVLAEPSTSQKQVRSVTAYNLLGKTGGPIPPVTALWKGDWA
jgi:hypothetical protein